MNHTLKRLLLAGTAAATISLGGQALAQTVTVNGANTNVTVDPAATPAINFLTSHIATVSDGVDLTATGTVTAAAANTGILTLSGTTTVAGAVGAGNALLGITTGGTAKAVIFNGTVNATTIVAGGTGSVAFNDDVTATTLAYAADGTITFADGKGLTGSIATASATRGTLTFLGDGSVSGTIGSSTLIGNTAATIVDELTALNGGAAGKLVTLSGDVTAAAINLTGTGTLDFDGNVVGDIDINNNAGTINIASGKLIIGSIGSTGGANGTVNFQGGTQSVTNIVSAGTVNVATGGTLTILGLNGANTTDFTGGTGTLVMASGGNVLGNVDSTVGPGGTLTLAGGTQTVTGTVGATNALTLVNAGATGGTTTFSSTVNATDIKFLGTGTIALADSTTANVTFLSGGTLTLANNKNIGGTIDGAGTLTVLGTSTLGAVGGTSTLSTVNAGAAGATVSFGGVTKASAINVTGTGALTFNGSVTGDLAFKGAGGATFADGSNMTGAVSTAATNTGTLTFNGDSAVSGNAGASGAVLNAITGGIAGKTVSFGGDVFATTINLSGTGVLDFNGNVAGIVDMNNNNGTVTLAAGKSLTGSIQSTGGANGTVTFEGGTQTVSGNIAGLAALNVGQAGGTTTLSGTVGATAISVGTGTASFADNVTGAVTLTGDGTVLLAAGKGITGNIIGAGGNIGTLTLAGNATLGASVDTGGNALKTLTLSGTGNTVTAGANSLAANTTNIGGNTLAVTGTFGAAAGQTLNFSLTGATTSGQVTATGPVTISADTNVAVNADAGGYVADTQSFTLVDGAGGGAVGVLNVGKLTDNSVLIDFTQTIDANDLIITASRTPLTTVATTPNAIAVATTLEAVAGTGDAALNVLQGKIQSAPTIAALNSALESAAPTVDGSHTVTVLSAASEVQSLTGKRVAFRAKDGETGVSSGNGMYMRGNIWYQLYGHFARQDIRDGIAGYDGRTAGVVIGADSDRLARDWVLGLALNYGNSSVDSNNANATQTDIDSYGLTGYGRYDPRGEHYYYLGQLGFAWNEVGHTRQNVGGPGLAATADYNSMQYALKGAVARDFHTRRGMTLTPSAFASWSMLSQDGYTETGNAATLNVTGVEDFMTFDLGLDLKAQWDVKHTGGGHFKPYVHAGYSYDLIGDKIETTASFTGGGGSFKTTGGDPAQGKLDAGFGVLITTREKWNVTADYNVQYRDDYIGHSGTFRAAYKF